MNSKEEVFVTRAFQELAPRYEETVDLELQRFWGISYSEFVENVLEKLNLQPDDLILDVATGTCVIPDRILNKYTNPPRIFGLDLTSGMLRYGQKKLRSHLAKSQKVSLTNADAMNMPFQSDAFDCVICGLATHHMNPPVMLAEMNKVLKDGGELILADVGGSNSWNLPGVKFIISLFALVYFTLIESYARARAEIAAIPNIYTTDRWIRQLTLAGFGEIQIVPMNSRYFWIPKPLIILARKNHNGGNK